MKRIGSTAQRLRELPYEKRVCRAEYYPHNFSFLPYLPPATVAPDAEKAMKEYVDIMHDVGLEVQVVVPQMDRGTPRFHSKMISPHPNVDQDLLPRYLEMAHEKGIIILLLRLILLFLKILKNTLSMGIFSKALSMKTNF